MLTPQVCQGLNTVVRTSARLQLCLRAAYYGHPDTYHKFDRGVFEKHAPTGKRLDRMIDVFSRWQRCAPKSVHRVGEPTCSRWKASSGLVVGCGVGTNPKSVEWNKELHYHPSMHEARDEPWPSQWSVWDVHGLRDVEFNAAARVPAYTVIAPAEFQDIDICREDNVVAVSVTSVQSMHGEMWLSIRVHCYLLEPTPAHKWESGATVRAIPYPGARGVKTAIPFSAAGMPFHHGVELPCNVQLGPGGTVIISPMGFMSRNLWDWRTGACIQVGSSSPTSS